MIAIAVVIVVVGQVGVVAVVGVVIVAVVVAGVTNRDVICIVSVSRFTVCVLRFCHRPICDGSEISIHSVQFIYPSVHLPIHPLIYPEEAA